jgi:drug/metabolite transporter (DMT)-like permease
LEKEPFDVPAMSDHAKGLAITGLGVLVLSPDALLLRLLEADHFTVVFWRALLMGLTLASVLALVYRGRADRALRAVGRWGLVSAHVYALNMITFVYSIHNTAVANTLVIIAAAPLFAAILSRVFLGEGVRPETWAATLIVLGGIAIVFWDGLAQGTWDGDLAALATALCLASNFTILRHRKHIDMVPATALGGFIAAAFLLVIGAAAPLSPRGDDWLVLALLGFFVVPVAFGLITIGPRYITAPEVGLLMLLETVLGPLWVWLALGERASALSLTGGAIVLVTLAVYFTWRLRGRRDVAAAHSSG